MTTTGLLLVGGTWATSCAGAGLWTTCWSRPGAGQVEMTGADGLLPALRQGGLERGLATESTEHLGYKGASRPPEREVLPGGDHA